MEGVCSRVFEGRPFEAASYCACWGLWSTRLLPHEGRLVVTVDSVSWELSVRVGLAE